MPYLVLVECSVEKQGAWCGTAVCVCVCVCVCCTTYAAIWIYGFHVFALGYINYDDIIVFRILYQLSDIYF